MDSKTQLMKIISEENSAMQGYLNGERNGYPTQWDLEVLFNRTAEAANTYGRTEDTVKEALETCQALLNQGIVRMTSEGRMIGAPLITAAKLEGMGLIIPERQ